MPAEGQNDWAPVLKAMEEKLIDDESPYFDDSDESFGDSSFPDYDSEYNFEDSNSSSDPTSSKHSEQCDLVEDIQDDLSEDEDEDDPIIPLYLFYLPSATRARNMAFNRCLLIDLNSITVPPEVEVIVYENKCFMNGESSSNSQIAGRYIPEENQGNENEWYVEEVVEYEEDENEVNENKEHENEEDPETNDDDNVNAAPLYDLPIPAFPEAQDTDPNSLDYFEDNGCNAF